MLYILNLLLIILSKLLILAGLRIRSIFVRIRLLVNLLTESCFTDLSKLHVKKINFDDQGGRYR